MAGDLGLGSKRVSKGLFLAGCVPVDNDALASEVERQSESPIHNIQGYFPEQVDCLGNGIVCGLLESCLDAYAPLRADMVGLAQRSNRVGRNNHDPGSRDLLSLAVPGIDDHVESIRLFLLGSHEGIGHLDGNIEVGEFSRILLGRDEAQNIRMLDGHRPYVRSPAPDYLLDGVRGLGEDPPEADGATGPASTGGHVIPGRPERVEGEACPSSPFAVNDFLASGAKGHRFESCRAYHIQDKGLR